MSCVKRMMFTAAATLLVSVCVANDSPTPRIQVSADGTHFVNEGTTDKFVIWGVNYDHDRPGRLLDEYWLDEWTTVEQDLLEIKSLGANCVRIHLQVGKFMDSIDTPNQASLGQLKKLLDLAESSGLYLNITGLACYHKVNIPEWYDALDEQARWAVQAKFWESIANVCKDSPNVFCYDLMNEPILPGETASTSWLAGELEGKHFVQYLTLSLNGRSREEVAKAWINRMLDAIRVHDKKSMVTVGVIPWVFVFGGGKPLFHSPEVGARLDFVAVHFYPKTGEVDKAIKALGAYEVGKPLVVEEMFPLACSEDELAEFVKRSSSIADGWFSFYWGATATELRANENPSMGEAITASWLIKFAELAKEYATPVLQKMKR